MANSIKIQKYVDKKGTASFLRELADALENGGTGELACVDDFQKIKIAIKNEFGQISVKAKIRLEGECKAPEDSGDDSGESDKPKYKHLKKRMKSSFRLLLKMIHDGQTPPEEAVESFLSDSALMVTYPGYGDEYYESYAKACEAFGAAYRSGDLGRMNEAIDALVHEKSRCHAKYD